MSTTLSNQKAIENIKNESYQEAIRNLDKVLKQNPQDKTALKNKARCYLVLNDEKKALEIYDKIIAFKKDPFQFERALVKGESPHFPALHKLQNQDHLFLNATDAYRKGKIITTMKSLEKAIQLDFDWQQRPSLDLLVSYLLEPNQFIDFEHIYIDAEEAVKESNPRPQNRWYSLSLPIHDYFAADSASEQKTKAEILFDLISPPELDHPLQGRKELKTILEDFLTDQEDARFGLEALKCLEENDTEKLGELFLALMLEHLMRFAKEFELNKEEMKKKQLADLLIVLPQRLALSLLFMLTVSKQKEAYRDSVQNNDKTGLLNLVALSFVSFYHQIGYYHKQNYPEQEQ